MAHTVATRPARDGDSWVRSALAQLGRLRGVHRAGLALAEGGGRRLLFSATDRDNSSRVDWCEVDAYEDLPLNHSVRTGQHVVGALDDLAARYPAFTGRQGPRTRALASFPIYAAGHVQGGYALYFDAPQRFDRGQLTELEDLAERLGASLRRAQRATSLSGSRSLEDEPVPPGARVAIHSVAADPRAAALARGFMLGTLAGWGIDADTIEKAVLCVSELVTNAIIHTDGGCQLRVLLDQGVLTTTVRDDGTSILVNVSGVLVEPLGAHGRGLQVVDALTTRWGSELDAVGLTVWFVLEPA